MHQFVRTFLCLFFGILAFSAFSQDMKLGKVEFHKSFPSEHKMIQSSSDKQIERLNNRRHRIEIRQGTKDTIIITDSTATFRFVLGINDSLHIKVNPRSRTISKSMVLHPKDIIDTLRLKISDRRLAAHIDSLQTPKFYAKYNERQAEIDFKNGKAQLLGSGSFIGEETQRRRQRFADKYKFEYRYVFGCFVSRPEIRIAHRYNRVMKKLLGIEENVW
nr:hypothetical protein [Allomuricauda sp.]